MRQSRRRLQWAVMGLAVVVIAAACASLPPARPVTSVSQIAGKWHGTGTGPGGSAAVRSTIDADGRATHVTPNQTITGRITLVDGKLRGRSDQGTTGTWTLHEGDGKRVLIYRSDDGRAGLELTPMK